MDLCFSNNAICVARIASLFAEALSRVLNLEKEVR
jgi:hypothetical protein